MASPGDGLRRRPNLAGQTPNLDRLAEQSVELPHAVAGCTVCSPYRASLLTGQYPHRHGVFLNDVRLQRTGVQFGEAYRWQDNETVVYRNFRPPGPRNPQTQALFENSSLPVTPASEPACREGILPSESMRAAAKMAASLFKQSLIKRGLAVSKLPCKDTRLLILMAWRLLSPFLQMCKQNHFIAPRDRSKSEVRCLMRFVG